MDLSGIFTTICLMSWLIGLIALAPTEAGKNRDQNRDKTEEKQREERRDESDKNTERDKTSRRRQHGADRGRDKDRRGREVEQLRCPPCEKLHCNPRKPSKLNCKGGIGSGICGCCPRCLKVEEELCGGKWNYLGSCDAGLECVHDAMLGIQSDVPREQRKGVCHPIPIERSQPVGVPGLPDLIQLDQGLSCMPKCTPEFCATDPKAICSAIDNVDRKKSCQGECQHTSCMACEFVALEPDCGRCGKNDYRCMRQFAKCIRRQICTKTQWPCGNMDQEETSGKFQCRVPDCIRG